MRTRLLRFIAAYLAAAAAATIVVLLVQSVQVLSSGLGIEALHDILPTAVIYGTYSLLFTLALGIAGWVLLIVGSLNGTGAYALVGRLLGFVAGGLFDSDGFKPTNPFLYSFSCAGLAAALTFRKVFYRRDGMPSSHRAAA